MGKLYDRLQKQLKTEHKKDAEDCLEIYNHLKETTGSVWESQWKPLVTVEFIGNYPYRRRYYLTSIGKIYLKGLTVNQTTLM